MKLKIFSTFSKHRELKQNKTWIISENKKTTLKNNDVDTEQKYQLKKTKVGV